MTVMETAQHTTTFTVRPAAHVPVNGDAGELLDRVLTALEDAPTTVGVASWIPRPIAPVCSYDYEGQTVDAVFQIEVDRHAAPTLKLGGATFDDATHFGLIAFHGALERAGFHVPIGEMTISIALGDDPDRLP